MAAKQRTIMQKSAPPLQRMTDQKQILTLLKTLQQEVAGVKSELKVLNLKVSGISMQVINELYL